jgi:lipoate-protein ligase A
MPPPVAVAPVRGLTVRAMLERNESALRAGEPAVLVSWITDEALTLGASQAAESPAALRARSLGLDVLRRGSGGTGVHFGEGDLAWAVVLPRSDPRVGGRFCAAYAPLGEGVVRWLAEAGVTARWRPSEGLETELCLLGPRGEVLDTGGRVLGGAAQHVTGRALLHEGVLPSRVRTERLGALFEIPPSRLRAELAGYCELGKGLEPSNSAASLAKSLEAALGGRGL